jgi:long-chain acyl-CoA synthetase
MTTLRDVLLTGARTYPTRPALRLLGGSGYSYPELHEEATRYADALYARGIRPGDRVALISENRPEWGICYLAITSMGAIVVPILTDFHPDEVNRILGHVSPALVVVSERLSRLAEGWPEDDVLTLDELASGRRTDDAVADDIHGAGDRADADTRHPSTASVFSEPLDPDSTAAIIYTSGTTGNPKGVMLSHRNIVTNARAAQAIPKIGPKDRLLSILPLAHTYECTIGFLVPLMSGACVTYLNGPPAISKLLPALAEVRPTMMLSVPLIMEKLYQSKVVPAVQRLPRWLRALPPIRMLVHRVAAGKIRRVFGGKLHFFGIGGAPLSPPTERFLREGRFPYAIGYGLTETAPLLAGTDAHGTRFRSTGPAVRGVELRLDPSGEIQARGPNIMQGYYRNPEATADAFTDDGWFKTGDLGSFDRKGNLFVRGRAKTMILGPSGENIYPEEIEATIDANALVEESLVLDKEGQLIARIRLNVEELAQRIGEIASGIDVETLRKKGQDVLDEIRKQVNAQLNRFSRISRVILQINPFERTPTKKIKRFLYQSDDDSDETDAGGSPA